MTVTNDKDVIVGEDLTTESKKLHTDDIAGTATRDSQEPNEIKPDAMSHNDSKSGNGRPEPLFAQDLDRNFRNRWRDIQTGFVDQPRSAVEQADELVAQLMQRLAQSFSEQRSNLEKQWEGSEKVSTEDLRVALTRYRSFFERLLSA